MRISFAAILIGDFQRCVVNEKRIMMDKWYFIHNGEAWWLRIQTIQQLFDYHEKTNNRWSRAFENFLRSNQEKTHMTDYLSEAIEMMASNLGQSFVETSEKLRMQIFTTQTEKIDKYGYININSLGGYNWIDFPIKQYLYREELIWPFFDNSDIRIKQWTNGSHWYAYIGDLEIKDELGNIKWDTYQEAMNVARIYVDTWSENS